MVIKYLKRFISVDRVPWENYEGNEKQFYNKKPKVEKREKGIPQGGVLSGLIANLYLHDFDDWIINSLKKSYDLQYVRYADDFVVLCKEPFILDKIKQEIVLKLKVKGLKLHDNEKKTKKIDLKIKGEYVEFVGFAISPTGIRIKKANIEKFKTKVTEIFHKTKLYKKNGDEINPVLTRITYKILGNEAIELRKCSVCGLYESKRSWLNYFNIITDVQQLRAIDFWIRREIYKVYFKNTNRRLDRRLLKKYKLVRLEDLYYKARKQKGKINSCNCSPLESVFKREVLINKLFRGDY